MKDSPLLTKDIQPVAMPHAASPKIYGVNDSAPLSVLVVAPDPRVHGGVAVFVRMMKSNLRKCRVQDFSVGSVQGQKETLWDVTKRMAITPFSIARLVKKQHFDVIHINPSLTYKSALRDSLILLGLRMSGYCSVLVYFHGWQHHVQKRIASTPGIKQLFVWLLNGTGHIMVLAPEFKQALEDMGVDGRRITFTTTMFDGGGLKEVAKEPHVTARRSILFMSRFVREKGMYELMDAFARMASEYPDVDIVMAGDGPERDGVRKHAAMLGLESRILFPGYVDGTEKFRMLRDCTLFALPTYLGEGMPVAILEAMGAGKPVITSKAGAIQYIVSDPSNGILLDKVSVDTVEHALRRLLSDKEYCDRVSAHNASYAWQRYEAAIVTAQIEALYNRIASPG